MKLLIALLIAGLYANYVILLTPVMAVSLKIIVVESICLLVVAISTIVVKNAGLNGCWECEDFSCGKDMFSDSHDIRLRAFVRCAKEEGLNKLAEYVVRNQQNGIYYGHNKDYDGLGSEEAVLRLLRTGQK